MQIRTSLWQRSVASLMAMSVLAACGAPAPAAQPTASSGGTTATTAAAPTAVQPNLTKNRPNDTLMSQNLCTPLPF